MSLAGPQRRRPDTVACPHLVEADSVRGTVLGERAAVMLTLIQTAKLNEIDPQAWLADVLARINDLNIHRLDDLLPWNWAAGAERRKVAA
jgi:IS66 C-terminal element